MRSVEHINITRERDREIERERTLSSTVSTFHIDLFHFVKEVLGELNQLMIAEEGEGEN